MRITFVLPPDSLSGGMRVIATYARLLARRGHRVVAIQPRHRRPTARETFRSLIRQKHLLHDLDRGPSHFDTPHESDGPTFSHIKLNHAGPVRETDLPDADIIIATWWETAEWVSPLPPQKGAKAYFIQHHEIHMHGQPADRVNATWRLPMRKITVAQWLADLAHDSFGDKEKNTIVVPNAADTDLFFAPPRDKQPIPTVGFMYSTLPFKGSDIAIKAIALAGAELGENNLRVICFGMEPPLPSMPTPPNSRFTLQPPQQKLRDLYAACDAWLFPSRVEGFGLPIVEAMACRTPVIGTPAGAAPELLSHGGGIQVAMEDPESMAQAIVRLCLLPDQRWRDMSHAARRTATSYTWEDATDRVEAALEQIRTGTPSPTVSSAASHEHLAASTSSHGDEGETA